MDHRSSAFLNLLKSQECAIKPSEIALLSNSRGQIRRERPDKYTNNGIMAERAKRSVRATMTSS